MKAILFCAGFFLSFSLAAAPSPQVQYAGVDAMAGGPRAVILPENAASIHTAQFLPCNKSGKIVTTNVAEQTEQALMNLKMAFNVVYRQPDLVKLNIYVTQNALLPDVRRAIAKFFGSKSRPAFSFVTTTLPDPMALVAVDGVAIDAVASKTAVELFHTNPYKGDEQTAQLSILPAGRVVYISGQAKEGTNLADSTRLTMESLAATLDWLKLKKSDVVQVKTFMRPMTNSAVVHDVMTNFFGAGLTPPLVQVEWISPKPQIEIELIAAAGPLQTNAAQTVTFSTPPGMTASGVYSKVATIEHGRRIYFSTFYGEKGTEAEQIKSIFSELTEWAGKISSDMQHLVKATYYVTDAEAGSQLNVLRPNYYEAKHPPAATKAMVHGIGQDGRMVTIDLIAVTK